MQQCWSRGIQQVRDYHGCQEYKLGSTPWWADGDLAVESRRLVGSLLASLRYTGWEVAGTVDISRQLEDKTMFLFRQTRGQSSLINHKPDAVCRMVDWACVSFHEADKIRFTIIFLQLSQSKSKSSLSPKSNSKVQFQSPFQSPVPKSKGQFKILGLKVKV